MPILNPVNPHAW